MMKQTLTTGTARLATLSGFSRPAAGKTGTTSDLKDTWFAGFTPQILTITWTGYDDNTPTTLTGATGALPLWIEFMKSASARESTDDFPWPKDMQKIKVSRDQIPTLISHPAPYEIENPPEFVQ
jgi:penicillin-binding protein 1B